MEQSEFNRGWIVGFIESEGVFTTNTTEIKRITKIGAKEYRYINPAFYLVSRDLSALETVKSLLKMGKINRHGEIFHLDIRRKSETIRLAAFLKDKLKSDLKRREFELWTGRVMEWKSRAWGHGKEHTSERGL